MKSSLRVLMTDDIKKVKMDVKGGNKEWPVVPASKAQFSGFDFLN